MQIVKKLSLVVGIVSIALAGQAVMAQQNAATATATATANIITAISISNTGALGFGSIVASNSGTVSISTTGVRSSTGVTLGSATGVSQANFLVHGQPNATYSITLPADGTVTLAGPDAWSMPVNAFVANVANPNAVLDGNGDQTLAVGATLEVGASQKVGVYSGTFDVTVNYN